jgi:hypothetical protein
MNSTGSGRLVIKPGSAAERERAGGQVGGMTEPGIYALVREVFGAAVSLR